MPGITPIFASSGLVFVPIWVIDDPEPGEAHVSNFESCVSGWLRFNPFPFPYPFPNRDVE